MKPKNSAEAGDFDYSDVASEYDKHRKDFPKRFFDELVRRNLIDSGKSILDLGAGTGMIARQIARIKPESKVTALDCAQGMLDAAADQDKKLGITNITYHCSSAEVTGLPDNSFDVIIAGRCWHWFDQAKAIEEVKRLCKPGATFIITHYDPSLEEGNPLDVTTNLIKEYDPTWELPIKEKLEREHTYLQQLMEADFSDVELQVFMDQKLISQREWVDFFKTTSGIGGNSKLTDGQKERLNTVHAERLKERFGGEKDLKITYVLSMMIFSAPKVANKEDVQLGAGAAAGVATQ